MEDVKAIIVEQSINGVKKELIRVNLNTPLDTSDTAYIAIMNDLVAMVMSPTGSCIYIKCGWSGESVMTVMEHGPISMCPTQHGIN